MGYRYQNWEDLRQRARDVGDAERYYGLCVKLGVVDDKIENRKLYDKGRQLGFDFEGEGGLVRHVQDGENSKPLKSKRKRKVNTSTYMALLQRAEGVNPKNVRTIRGILFDTFGRRFSPYGKTPLSEMDDGQVLGAWRGIINYAERRVGESMESSGVDKR